MPPLVIANGLIAMLELVMPKIEALVKKGEVTPEEQQALMNKIEALKSDPSKFSGPEWEPSGRVD
jgi:hypothetical protein